MCIYTNNKFTSTKDGTYSPLEWNKKSFRNLRKQNPFSPNPFKSKRKLDFIMRLLAISKILNLRNIWSFEYFTA
jgi:hypothetical protein